MKKFFQLTFFCVISQALIPNSFAYGLPKLDKCVYTVFILTQVVLSFFSNIRAYQISVERNDRMRDDQSGQRFEILELACFDYFFTFLTSLVYLFIGVMSIFGLMPQVTAGLNIITLIAQIVLAIYELHRSHVMNGYGEELNKVKFIFRGLTALSILLSILHLILIILNFNFPNQKCAWMALKISTNRINRIFSAILELTSFIVYSIWYGMQIFTNMCWTDSICGIELLKVKVPSMLNKFFY